MNTKAINYANSQVDWYHRILSTVGFTEADCHILICATLKDENGEYLPEDYFEEFLDDKFHLEPLAKNISDTLSPNFFRFLIFSLKLNRFNFQSRLSDKLICALASHSNEIIDLAQPRINIENMAASNSIFDKLKAIQIKDFQNNTVKQTQEFESKYFLEIFDAYENTFSFDSYNRKKEAVKCIAHYLMVAEIEKQKPQELNLFTDNLIANQHLESLQELIAEHEYWLSASSLSLLKAFHSDQDIFNFLTFVSEVHKSSMRKARKFVEKLYSINVEFEHNGIIISGKKYIILNEQAMKMIKFLYNKWQKGDNNFYLISECVGYGYPGRTKDMFDTAEARPFLNKYLERETPTSRKWRLKLF